MADVGFRVEAAARVHKLEFIPLASERYFLAGTRSAFTKPQAIRLLSAASGEPFTKIVRTLAGYQLLDPSKLTPARDLLIGAVVDSGRISTPARQPGKPRGKTR